MKFQLPAEVKKHLAVRPAGFTRRHIFRLPCTGPPILIGRIEKYAFSDLRIDTCVMKNFLPNVYRFRIPTHLAVSPKNRDGEALRIKTELVRQELKNPR